MPTLMVSKAEHKEILWLSRHLNLDEEGVSHSIGRSHGGDAFPGPASNPHAPLLVLDDGRRLGGYEPLLLHLAEGSPLIPTEPFERAKMIEWMLWARRIMRPAVAAGRRQREGGWVRLSDSEARALRCAFEVFEQLDLHLGSTRFLLGRSPSLADLVLIGPIREAPEAGFNLMPARSVWKWRARVELHFDISEEPPGFPP